MSPVDHSRRFDGASITSSIASLADIADRVCQVRKVPILLQKSVEAGREA